MAVTSCPTDAGLGTGARYVALSTGTLGTTCTALLVPTVEVTYNPLLASVPLAVAVKLKLPNPVAVYV
jgi:hypothetical protein